FLVFTMNRFCSGLMSKPSHPSWSTSLFCMDLDGVFDSEVFGFPHATLSSLEALEILQSNGFSVMLNTGRSIAHVRNYCHSYTLPGGIAEYGSVFFDHCRGQEYPLTDAQSLKQLEHCAELIGRLDGVFVDPAYRYSIRAYRANGTGTAGLRPDEVENLLQRWRFDKLSYICRGPDSYIVAKGTNKGAAIREIRQCLGLVDGPLTAIGDSDQDVPMLKEAKAGYAPANCSAEVRHLSGKGRVRIMREPHQRGLLAAVHDMIPDSRNNRRKIDHGSQRIRTISGMMVRLLRVAELSRARRLAAAMNWRSL
ncbi:MAG TPA: HAD hydrolase family protein, partial [Bacteroidota bacterium]